MQKHFRLFLFSEFGFSSHLIKTGGCTKHAFKNVERVLEKEQITLHLNIREIFVLSYDLILQYFKNNYCITFESALFYSVTILLLKNTRSDSDCRKCLFRLNMLGILLFKQRVYIIIEQSHRTWGSNWQTDFNLTLV